MAVCRYRANAKVVLGSVVSVSCSLVSLLLFVAFAQTSNVSVS